MILTAALLVLVALGLFVAGLVTGVTALYWACVGVSVLAAGLLFVARRRLVQEPAEEARPATATATATRAAERRSARPEAEEAEGLRAAAADPPPAAPAAVEPPAAAPAAAEPPVPPPVAAAEPPATPAAAAEPPSTAPPAVAAATPSDARPLGTEDGGDPPAEEVEVTDLLLVVDMHDDVFVVDEHPRYHLADCRWLDGREAIPFPVDEARTDGFTPCGLCSPDRHLAQVARARKAAGRS